MKVLFENTPPHAWTVEGPYRELKKRRIPIPDTYVSDLEGGNPGVLSEESAALWRLRLKRAIQGSEPESLLRRLTGETSPSQVDWLAVLRNFVVAHVKPTTIRTWSRPGRRSLAAGAAAQYLNPCIERERGPRRLGVVVDTSGSIEETALKIFTIEINSLLEKTGTELVLVAADAVVGQPVVVIRRRIAATFQFKGSGGTDFRPALKELEKYQIDCCVYFTDLLGAFPRKRPQFPLLWAATTDLNVPFGRRIRIKV